MTGLVDWIIRLFDWHLIYSKAAFFMRDVWCLKQRVREKKYKKREIYIITLYTVHDETVQGQT